MGFHRALQIETILISDGFYEVQVWEYDTGKIVKRESATPESLQSVRRICVQFARIYIAEQDAAKRPAEPLTLYNYDSLYACTGD